MRRALQESRNIPAVRVAQAVGPDRIADTARRLGIASPLATVPSLALGTSEVTLLEITRAYATLANQGVRTTPTTLGAAARARGCSCRAPLPAPERGGVRRIRVSDDASAAGRDARRHRPRAAHAGDSAKSTAGKTGSTDDLRDAWFVGYTTDLVVGVWVGLDDGSPLGFTGAQAALPIWAAVMSAAVRRTRSAPVRVPAGCGDGLGESRHRKAGLLLVRRRRRGRRGVPSRDGAFRGLRSGRAGASRSRSPELVCRPIPVKGLRSHFPLALCT